MARKSRRLEHGEVERLCAWSGHSSAFLGALRSSRWFERLGVEPLAGVLRSVVRIADLIGALSVLFLNSERRAGLYREHCVDAPAADDGVLSGPRKRIRRCQGKSLPRVIVGVAFGETHVAVRG